MALPARKKADIPDTGGAVVADPNDPNMTPIPSRLSTEGRDKKRVSAKDAIAAIKEAERWEALEKERLRREEEDRKEKEEQEAVRLQLEQEEKERKRKEEEAALAKIDRARVWIAAETDAIYDWQRRKMILLIPVTQSCRSALERTLCEKMRWQDMGGYTFYKALGTSADTVEPSDDVLQTNLTPQQLRMTTSGVNFVMVRKSKRDEERLLPAYDYFLQKAEKFLELYDPHKKELAPQMLREFQNNEQDLIDAFLRRYGPEPTWQQILDKRAFLKLQRERADAAAERARQAGLTNSIRTLSEREKENVMRILEKLVFTRIMRTFYRKWQAAVRKHRLANLICELSNRHLERIRRKEYFGKLKLFAENKKNKRQLAASSQIAIKNEGLLGDLASENMGLKNEIRKLVAHIEVLENASSKRLETLYGGSEAAVVELKRLTAELRFKAVQVHQLEGKVRDAQEKVDKAEGIRDEAVEKCNAKLQEFDAQDGEYRGQQTAITAQLEQLQDKIDAVTNAVRGTGHSCKHCPHYHGLLAQSTLNKNTIDQMRNRIENAEAARRNIGEALEKLREKKAEEEQAAAIAAGGGAGVTSRSGTKSVTFDGGADAKGGPSLPQVLIDLDERKKRLAGGEYDDEIPLTPALLSLLSKEEQDKYKKMQEDATKPKSMMQLMLEQKKDIEDQADGREPSGGADSSAGGDKDSAVAGSQGGMSGGSSSVLGPVGRANLSMAKYFKSEHDRSAGRVQGALEKRWELKPKTRLATYLEEQRKLEAAEQAKQAQYALTRRQANAQGIIFSSRAQDKDKK